MVSPDIPFSEKVDAYTDRRSPGACWPWRGGMVNGRPYIRRKSVLLFVYEREYGPVPPGFRVVRNDHDPGCPRDCVHSRCVNPAHLTMAPNGGPRRTQDICNRGHDLTLPENVYEAAGRRWCKQCYEDYRADWKRRNPNYQRDWRARRRRNGRSSDP